MPGAESFSESCAKGRSLAYQSGLFSEAFSTALWARGLRRIDAPLINALTGKSRLECLNTFRWQTIGFGHDQAPGDWNASFW
jgi:hypothetical protein